MQFERALHLVFLGSDWLCTHACCACESRPTAYLETNVSSREISTRDRIQLNLINYSSFYRYLEIEILTFGERGGHGLAVELETYWGRGHRHLIAGSSFPFAETRLFHARNKLLVVDFVHHFLVTFNKLGKVTELGDRTGTHELGDRFDQGQRTALLLKLVCIYTWERRLHQTCCCTHWTLSNAQVALGTRTVRYRVIVMVIFKVVSCHAHIKWLKLIMNRSIFIFFDTTACPSLDILPCKNIILRAKSRLGFHSYTLSFWNIRLWTISIPRMHRGKRFLELR